MRSCFENASCLAAVSGRCSLALGLRSLFGGWQLVEKASVGDVMLCYVRVMLVLLCVTATPYTLAHT